MNQFSLSTVSIPTLCYILVVLFLRYFSVCGIRSPNEPQHQLWGFHREYSTERFSSWKEAEFFRLPDCWSTKLRYLQNNMLFLNHEIAFHPTNSLSLQIKGWNVHIFSWSLSELLVSWPFLLMSLERLEDVCRLRKGRSEEACSTNFNHKNTFLSPSCLTACFLAFVINETLFCLLECSGVWNGLTYKHMQYLLRHSIHPTHSLSC